jgi:hypothetical protein
MKKRTEEGNTTELRFPYYISESDLEDIMEEGAKLLGGYSKEDVWFRVTIEIVEGEMPNDPL